MPDPVHDNGRAKVLMVGPLPPPIGGVANFVKNINAKFSSNEKYELKIFRIGTRAEDESHPLIPFRDMKRFLGFVKDFKKCDPDIVHVHSSAYYSFLRSFPYMFWTRYFSHARLVVHFHSGLFGKFYHGTHPPVRYLVRKMITSADAVIVTSPSWKKLIKEISGREQGIHPIANGFDPSIFHPMDKKESRKMIGLPENGRILVTVGYLENVKGHRFLIQAMRDVVNKFDDARAFIVGSGTLEEPLLAQVEELGLKGKVNFMEGGQTSETIALWINSSDLFVLPSLNEGNPTVLFESLGCGRPFLGTRVGGIPDVVNSEKVGLLCEPSDPHGLAIAIITALQRTWDERYISAYAKQYTWESIATKLMEIYGQTLEKDDSSRVP